VFGLLSFHVVFNQLLAIDFLFSRYRLQTDRIHVDQSNTENGQQREQDDHD